MKPKYLIPAILTAAFAVMFGGPEAYADSILQLRYTTDGGAHWTTFSDNGIDHTININTATGIWSVLIETGQAGGATDDYPLDSLHLDLSSDVTANSNLSSPSDLEIQLTQIDVTPSASGWNLTWGPTFTGSGLTATLAAYADTSDTPFGTSTPLGSIGPVSQSNSYPASGTVNLNAPYSLTLDLTVEAAPNANHAQITGDALLQLTPVPEPSSLMLLGAGLLLFGTLKTRSKMTATNRN